MDHQQVYHTTHTMPSRCITPLVPTPVVSRVNRRRRCLRHVAVCACDRPHPIRSRPGAPCVTADAATVLAYAYTMPSRADRAGSVLTGEQDEAIRQLIAIGQEKGYLLSEEIDAVLPADVTAASVLNDLLDQCRDAGIDVDSESLERAGTRLARMASDEPDKTPSRPDASSDVVRLYFADMKRVPLLTREEEVALAKQIERQVSVSRLSRKTRRSAPGGHTGCRSTTGAGARERRSGAWPACPPLIFASHSALPHQGAITKPGRPSSISTNSSRDVVRVVCASRNALARSNSSC